MQIPAQQNQDLLLLLNLINRFLLHLVQAHELRFRIFQESLVVHYYQQVSRIAMLSYRHFLAFDRSSLALHQYLRLQANAVINVQW